MGSTIRQVAEELDSRTVRFVDLTGVFDQTNEQVYVDSGHYKADANGVISTSLSEILKDMVSSTESAP